MKWFISSVLPGMADVLASFFLPHNIFIRLDFPTFERPMNAYSILLSFGHIDSRGALKVNSAVFISIAIYLF